MDITAAMEVDSPPTLDMYGPREHKEMDDNVLASLNERLEGRWPENPSRIILLVVLQLVVEFDQRLDRKWLDWKAAEKVPDEVWATLREAWKTRSFQKVRILRCIQAPTTTRPSHDMQASLAAAMADTYKGNYVKAFIRYLESNERSYVSGYHGRFCSITQSSGTGKTRLLYELGKQGVCVLYINIRSRHDTLGYPPRDDIPADILTADLPEEEYSTQCQAFFATVFKCLGAFFEKGISFEMLFNHEMRTRFFQDVQRVFSNIKEEMLKSSTRSNQITKRYLKALVDAPCFLQAEKSSPRVVIAIDESHVLHELEGSDSPATVLLRTIKSFSGDESLWVVFASTADLTAPKALFPSARVAFGGEKLFPPFTLLGWDQHAPALEDVELDKVALGSHLLRYGRPLWWSLKNGQGVANIVELAGEKLCGSNTFDALNRHQAFAVLGQRFGLNIAFGQLEAIEYNSELVARHLRVCVRTTEDRTWSYTTYPSEPVVSAAAAQLLHEDQDNLANALVVVSSCVNDGLINAEDSGELASRFIWLLAKDHCVQNGHVLQSFTPHQVRNGIVHGDYELPYCQLVPVVEFLKVVFGSEIADMAPGMQTTFGDAYINFSHWIQMGSNITQDTGGVNDVSIEEWTESLWARTAAVQCCRDQPYIGKVIPVFFKSRPREDSMSHILISDEACDKSQLKDIARHKITPADYSGPPYIVILADLGVKNPPEDQRLIVLDDSGEESSDRCLRIYAASLENETYQFLESKIVRELRDLYAQQDAPLGLQKELEHQMQFGISRERQYLNWNA